MTKYKFKIDTPWGKKGDIYTVNNIWNASLKKWEKPNIIYDFPDLFEPVPELSNRNKFEKILMPYIRKIIISEEKLCRHKFLQDLGVSFEKETIRKEEEILSLIQFLADNFNADSAYDEVFGGEK